MRYSTLFVLVLVGAGSAVAFGETPIAACPFIINTPGNYVVTADLTCPGTDGISIMVSNVSLKLNGHTITGTGVASTSGIRAIGPGFLLQRIGIEGPGLIEKFGNGIYLNASYSQIGLVTSAHNTFGFVSDQGLFLTIQSNAFVANGNWGLQADCYSCTIAYNRASGNGLTDTGPDAGMLIAGSGNTVNNNYASGNGKPIGAYGMGIGVIAQGSRIYANVTDGNGQAGIVALGGGLGNKFFNNTSSVGNGNFDLQDNNAFCDANLWADNVFFKRNLPCIH